MLPGTIALNPPPIMVAQTNGSNGISKQQPTRNPLKYTGSLDKYESAEMTTIIGRQYPNLQLSSLLKAENADVLLRDLAITGKYL